MFVGEIPSSTCSMVDEKLGAIGDGAMSARRWSPLVFGCVVPVVFVTLVLPGMEVPADVFVPG